MAYGLAWRAWTKRSWGNLARPDKVTRPIINNYVISQVVVLSALVRLGLVLRLDSVTNGSELGRMGDPRIGRAIVAAPMLVRA